MKNLMHQQPYKEILWSLDLAKHFSLKSSSSYWFPFDLTLSLWLPLWKSSCLITLEIWSLVPNLVFLSSKSRLTKPCFHTLQGFKYTNHNWRNFWFLNGYPYDIPRNWCIILHPKEPSWLSQMIWLNAKCH